MADDATRVVVLAAAGTGLMMAETVSRCTGLAFAGFLDDNPAKQAHGYAGHQVLGPLAAWSRLPGDYRFLSSLYGPKRNADFRRLVDRLEIPDERLATVVDPSAVVSPTARLSSGVFVGPLCIVEPEAQLDHWSALLGSVHVAHHAHLARYVACANRASICGGATVGQAAFLGAASVVREYLRIGDHAVIGMGSVVLTNVAAAQTVVGNPARPREMPNVESQMTNQ